MMASHRVFASTGYIQGQTYANNSIGEATDESDIVKLMTELFQDQEVKQKQLFKEMEERQQSEMRRPFVSVIAKHIQWLSAAIDKERSDRVQAISEVHDQFN